MFRQLITSPRVLPEILRFLLMRRQRLACAGASPNFVSAETVRVFTDQQEQKAMKICRPRCIKIIKELVESIEGHGAPRTVDCGAGTGTCL